MKEFSVNEVKYYNQKQQGNYKRKKISHYMYPKCLTYMVIIGCGIYKLERGLCCLRHCLQKSIIHVPVFFEEDEVVDSKYEQHHIFSAHVFY